ncbi:glycosyltransferase family 4 protein [Vibrio mytili]|uniref:glycosyltransferase family 4 protein n=1 Tax=Vibrio mytili TaxID=50718 RepID=UPI003C6EC6AA
MKKINIVVPGWPSEESPGRMAFFYEQVKNLSIFDPTLTITVYILERRLIVDPFRKYNYLDLDLNIEVIVFPYYEFPKIRSINRFLNEIASRKFKKIIQKNDIGYKNKVIHAHFIDSLMMISNISLDYNIIWTEHASNFELYIKKHKFKRVQKEVKKVKQCIFVSEPLKQFVTERLLIEDINTVVIPNGVDTEVLNYKENHFKPRNFLFIGHLNYRKGIMNAIKGFKSAKLNDSTLTIYGSGELELEAKAFVNSTGLKRRVSFKGQLDNTTLRNTIYNYDCLILPSESESFGVVVIEAMASGLATIVTKCGGPEYILNNDASLGVVLENNSAENIAKSIDYVSGKSFDPNYIRNYAANQYSWVSVINKISEVYSVNTQ